MKKFEFRRFFLCVVLMIMGYLINSCASSGTSDIPDDTGKLPTPPANQNDLVQTNFLPTGQYPNDIKILGNTVYIANSGSNNVEAYELNSKSKLATLVCPQYSSPSYLAVSAEKGVVVCNGNNKVVTFSTSSMQEFRSIDIGNGVMFQGPGSPALYQGRIYVPNANIKSFYNEKTSTPYENDKGTVTVIANTDTVEQTITTTLMNPSYCYVANNELYVVCTGGQSVEKTKTVVKSEGGIEVYSLPALAPLATIKMGLSLPSRMVIVGTMGYLGSSLKSSLYKVDLANRTVLNGLSNPIVLNSTSSSMVSALEITSSGWLFAGDFTDDTIHVVDTRFGDRVDNWIYKTPFKIPAGIPGFAGPTAIAARETGLTPDVFILQGLANRIDSISIGKYGKR